MVKMVRLEKTKADREAEKDALGETGIASVVPDGDSGISVHLDHHHLEKLGVGGSLKSGNKVELSGPGWITKDRRTMSAKTCAAKSKRPQRTRTDG